MIKKILLLGLEPNSGNFGCSALANSFFNLLNDIAKEDNIKMDVYAVCSNYFELSGNDFFSVKCLKMNLKNIKFWNEYYQLVKNAYMVFDFSEGDSFSDIYGMHRFITRSLLKELAVRNNKKFILGPQTLGPFKHKLSKKWARLIMERSYRVYTRDEMSMKYAEKLGIKTNLTTDIAFMLPCSNHEYYIDKRCFNLGLNVSALLWNGGYKGNNGFNLKIDYQQYIKDIIEYANKHNICVHLIPHVLSDDYIEDDYAICNLIHNDYKKTIMSPRFSSPMEAKKYMSNCDLFIGSRMHATIGAFSMEIPIIAVAYSRKFQGLYSSLGYKYVIDAVKMDTKQAVDISLEWIMNIDLMKNEVKKGYYLAKSMNNNFKNEIRKLFIS